uniref:C2H2-type domain-containing protein n=1 Tax=Cacopsylla melanoneura TaxID=428564 RepID=A0A8D8VS37_9HEMI
MSEAAEKRANRHEEEENWDWKCPLCPFLRHGRRGRQYVQSHITQCHREEAEASQLSSLNCEYCGHVCGSKAGLTSHLRHRHPDIPLPGLRPLKLSSASTTTSVPPRVAQQAPTPSAPSAAVLSGFVCNRCGRVCRSKAGLVSHEKGASCQIRQPLERGGNVGPTNA